MGKTFYLGRLFDIDAGAVTTQTLGYEADDLTTHAIVVGMTGSGKTGLCVALMEEAALQGIPALLIDPKGDLTNLLLHFPNLAPEDFRPWVDVESARRAGKSVEQAAAEAAAQWRAGLDEWGLSRANLQALQEAVQYAVYTPGSDAGLPVNIVGSLTAPGLDWATNREALTERISSTVTAILGLAGFQDVDPLRSREHVLLSHIFQTAWSQNASLDLNELILQVQSPPFDKVGAFPVDTFLLPKERVELALRLNNILAAPSFELWRIGQPLDVAALLSTPEGRPRHSIFYLAHLSEAERMFFVTLLFTAVEAWMRGQPGSPNLRAIVYMDEIHGYLPPAANPSSKPPLMRLLKQGRAFGLGLLLATQNPVDMDYKALSNAGTWFIGKLQTDQDKQRLLDGLEGVRGDGLNRAMLDRLISRLEKRVFLLHNVHASSGAPTLFYSRWAMNYLAGPLTRAQIPALNRLAGVVPETGETASPSATGMAGDEARLPAEAPSPVRAAARSAPLASTSGASRTRPAPPAGVAEFFLPLNLSLAKAAALAGVSLPAEVTASEVLYRPALLASASVRFLDRKFGVDSEVVKSVLVPNPDRRGLVRWEDFVCSLPSPEAFDPAPASQALFAALEASLADARLLTALQRDFADWIYRTVRVNVRANETLGVYATPEVSQAEFLKACSEAARQARDAEVARTMATLDRQIKTLQDKIAREERELRMDEIELSERKQEELATHAENVLGALGVLGRRSARRLSTSLTKHRLTEQAKAEVDESIEALRLYREQLARLEEERQRLTEEINARWGEAVHQVTQIAIAPKKNAIFITLFGIAWVPYYLVQSDEKVALELPAFAATGE